ncbi:MAG: GAF domain-containing protein, partial [Phyllobacteriaceae bacterium]|nr:GAF domain-containing protein [Phyllobacteriaceae bacterium]
MREGIDPGDAVSSIILRSWRRSGAHGLDMDRRPAFESLSHAQLREIRERNEILLRAARGELELLHEDARLTGGIAILTDPHGTVLATVGNVDFAERASRVALRPGVQWSEAAIGTNAIGTAIAEGSPITVSGGEHFFEAQAILGCSAVPIFDPSGELIGVLDFSNDAGVPQTHTLALVRRAVEQIEHRLFEQRFGRHVRMHFHADPDLVMSPHEGLLAFDGSCLVGANRQGLDLLGLDWSALGVLGFDQIFDTGRDQITQADPTEPSRIRTRRGSVL